MRSSHYLFATLKESPADAEIISHQLMLRAGMIRKLSSGIYTWLPLGLKVLQKVENIVRAEMNRAGCLEIQLPCIQPAELWQATGRWEPYGPELLKLVDRHEREFCYAPTAEDVVTEVVKNLVKSYKQLPLNVYQINTKFRDEIRPRFGVMRAREFLMKDAYSFHIDKASLKKTYQTMYEAYHRVFEALGLKFRAVQADNGNMGGEGSHEFQVLAEAGEDMILYSDGSDYAANVEVAEKQGLKAGDKSPDGQGILHAIRGIEVGHIFQLGDKYSRALNAEVHDEHGKQVKMEMGCYGIGVSRVVAAGIEQRYDERGIIWPAAMAPFDVVIIPIGYHRSESVRKEADKLYQQLQAQGFDVLLDDRDERPGVMFAEMDLIGVPKRIVMGEKSLANGEVEYKERTVEAVENIRLDAVVNRVK